MFGVNLSHEVSHHTSVQHSGEQKHLYAITNITTSYNLFGMIEDHTGRVVNGNHDLVLSFIRLNTSQPELVLPIVAGNVFDYAPHAGPLSSPKSTSDKVHNDHTARMYQDQTHTKTQNTHTHKAQTIRLVIDAPPEAFYTVIGHVHLIGN
jgi:hypothetical protein